MSRSGLPSSCTDSRDRDSRTVTHHIRVSLIMSNELIIKLQGTSKAANLNDGSESGWVLQWIRWTGFKLAGRRRLGSRTGSASN
jgi:hypothetical protein